jgi:DNA repair protein RecN (Recombination protein N)
LIERFYLKDNLSFSQVDLEFKNGLVVFSGASGSGKSVLFDSILAIFGLSDPKGAMSEISLDSTFDLSDFGIENSEDLTIFKQLKKDKNRYFVNNQFVSKSVINSISKEFIRFLNLKDYSDFSNDRLLELLDIVSNNYNSNHEDLIIKYKELFKEYNSIKNELSQIEEEESQAIEKAEFLAFEIEKIDSINPQIGEYEKLLDIKRQLSKKEKIANLLSTANEIFNYESVVFRTLEELNIDSGFFGETMINLKTCFEDINSQFEELDSMDIEDILGRLSSLSDLSRKYGSIEESIKAKEDKLIELDKYKNITFHKDTLKKDLEKVSKSIQEVADKITFNRQKASSKLVEKINDYAKMLYLSDVTVSIVDTNLGKSGQDLVSIFLDNTDLKNVSSGEFNRLRLSLICASNDFNIKKDSKGILILDEIDSNLSGKESQSVANVLKHLSSNYQILSISHQPQLTSIANQHFLVQKNDDGSFVTELSTKQRIDEIARMISGDKVTKEAKELAKKLLSSS